MDDFPLSLPIGPLFLSLEFISSSRLIIPSAYGVAVRSMRADFFHVHVTFGVFLSSMGFYSYLNIFVIVWISREI